MKEFVKNLIIFSVIVIICNILFFYYTTKNWSNCLITSICIILIYVIVMSMCEYINKENFTNNDNKKIFGIGLFKTGTSSLGDALSELGYKTSSDFIKLGISEDVFWDVNSSDGFKPYFSIIKKYLKNYDAFSDSPWLYLYRELDEWYPNSKFILTIRDPEKLAISDIKMWKRMGRKPKSKDEYIERYNKHVKNVKEYFKNRPNDLLILDVSSPNVWKELCNFLDIKNIPNKLFPKSNTEKIHSELLKN